MKIIYISESQIPSQSANSIHVMKMCNAMVELGHDVTLIGIDNQIGISNIHQYYGVSDKIKLELIQQSKLRYINQIINGKKIKKIVESLKPDLLIGRSLSGFYFCSDLGIPYIFESHEPILNKNYRLNGKFFKLLMLKKILKSKNIKSFVLISEELKNLYNFAEFPALNVIVAHDGADNYNFEDKIALQGNSNKLEIGYLGKFFKGRGIDLIIKIAKELPEFQFHLVGGKIEDLKNYYPKIKPTPNIYFYGFINPVDAHKYRNSFDILLAPYQNEENIGADINTTNYMSPLKIFEYMSAKKAIISSNFKVLNEVLNDKNSILVEPSNVESWVSAIKKLENKDFREQLSQNSYNDFKNNYTWKKRAEKIITENL